ncbi:unnamed protein product, partial [Discosporangium mesarthrocarpum]
CIEPGRAAHTTQPCLQAGVTADATRDRARDDYTCFRGRHTGAETLVFMLPASGWAAGSAELAHSDRLSRSRMTPQGAVADLRDLGGVGDQAGVLEHSVFTGHTVPARDLQQP